jgi:UDP-glucuronate 4-epimerase
MSTLVTGHAGFIGSHLVDTLLAEGEEVVGLDNRDPFYPTAVKEGNLAAARDHQGFLDLEGDIRDPAIYERIPPAVDRIVHLAALAGVRPSIREPARYQSVNLEGTTRLLEFARERGIGRFVFASSSSVYGNNEKVPFSEDDPVDYPISPYAATKRAGELLCHTWAHLFGIRVICLRFFTVYGPRQRPDLAIHKFARLLDQGEPLPMFGDGTTRRDYTYIDDVIQGVTGAIGWVDRAPEGAFQIVNLGESQTVSLQEMIDTLAQAMEVEPEIRQLPEQPGDVEQTWADVTRAREFLGYDPRVAFPEGIRRFVEWYREEGRG